MKMQRLLVALLMVDVEEFQLLLHKCNTVDKQELKQSSSTH